jgi:hypothetical protein
MRPALNAAEVDRPASEYGGIEVDHLKPVITRGAETMNTIFKQNQANSA